MEERPIFLTVDRQIRPLIRKTRSHIFPDVNSETRPIPGIHRAIAKEIGMGKRLFRLRVMQHVFLNAEIIDRDIQVQSRGHAHRRHVARPMATSAHVINSGEIGNLLHRCQAAAVHHAHAQVVDKLLADKVNLGADASIAAGPVGRAAAASTDVELRAEILAYSRAQGVFAGINLSGGVLRPEREANERTYGPSVSTRDVLFRNDVQSPPAAQEFLRTLRQESRATSEHR